MTALFFILQEHLFLLEELEELIQLRQDHDTGAAIGGATNYLFIKGIGASVKRAIPAR